MIIKPGEQKCEANIWRRNHTAQPQAFVIRDDSRDLKAVSTNGS